MVAEGRASGKAVAPQFATDGGGITAHHAAGRAPESAHEELTLALGARDAVAARAAIERDIDPVIRYVQEQAALR
jgi:DNA-binding GntR family transcriptional regulator